MRKLPLAVRVALGLVLSVIVLLVVAGACVSQPFVRAVPPRGPAPAVDPERLRTHVKTLTVDLYPRTGAERLDAVAKYLRKTLGRGEEQTFVVDGATYRNVVVSFGPENGERVVIGAHYDAANSLPGADDNASGVAGLLELAPMLAAAKLNARVDLVFWTLEEPPYFRTPSMGSVDHAKRLRGAHVRGAISLEMIGYFSDAENSQHFPAPGMGLMYPTKGNFIAVVGRPADSALTATVKGAMRGATDLPVFSLNAPAAVQGIDWSDHRSYWAEGFTAVMITDTSYLRNDRYHTARDTFDTLDYARMAKVVEAAFAAVVALAQ
jgi:hypothetical protein